MSISYPSIYDAARVVAEMNEYDKHVWVDLWFFGKEPKWARKYGPPSAGPDRITIHFEPESLGKFQMLAEAINHIFGEPTNPSAAEPAQSEDSNNGV